MSNPSELLNTALTHLQAGRLQEAAAVCHCVLSEQPGHADAMYMLGAIAYQNGSLDEAINWFQQVLQEQPHRADVLLNLANTLENMGQTDEAMDCYRSVLQLQPDNVIAHFGLGNLYHVRQRYQDAVTCFQEVIRLSPGFAAAWNNLGSTFRSQNRLDQALQSFQKAVTISPDYAEAYYNLANLFQAMEQPEQAVASYQQALLLKPDLYDAYLNLGNLYLKQQKLAEAFDVYSQACQFAPALPKAYNNLGLVCMAQMQLTEAVRYFEKALKVDPDFPKAHLNRAMFFLLQGKYDDAWLEYEWRFLDEEFHPLRTFTQPLWDGSDLSGRRILVVSEQGYGDTFQFMRFLPWVKAKGGTVIFECQPALYDFLAQARDIDELLASNISEPPSVAHDVYIHLMSLPMIFKTTLQDIPPPDNLVVPLESRLIERWRQRLDQYQGFKVGIAWTGSPKNLKNQNRSCLLSQFSAFAGIHGAVFFSLQKGPEARQAESPPEGIMLVDLGREITSFSDTAAIIQNLDLVISVDTAIVHLAGVLRKAAWVLLAYEPDWRWLLERTDSPWYPTVRLFRQPQPGDWASVFNQVAEALQVHLKQVQSGQAGAISK